VKINQIISINYGLVYSNDFVSMFEANERKRERERDLTGKHSGTSASRKYLYAFRPHMPLTL
jgi:hypothetical protein